MIEFFQREGDEVIESAYGDGARIVFGYVEDNVTIAILYFGEEYSFSAELTSYASVATPSDIFDDGVDQFINSIISDNIENLESGLSIVATPEPIATRLFNLICSNNLPICNTSREQVAATMAVQTIQARGTGTAAIEQAVSDALTKAAPTTTPTSLVSPTDTITPTPLSTPAPGCEGVTTIPEKECNVLVKIYNDMDGINWRKNKNWLETNDPCGWYGVSCSEGFLSRKSSNKFVTSISLNSNYLSGIIPPEISNLTRLKRLDLGNNLLTGSIPPELGNAKSLTYLFLYGNKLSGSVPEEIDNLNRLKYLGIGGNKNLEGPLPLNLVESRGLLFISFEGTKICEPRDEAFQEWLNSRREVGTTGRKCPADLD